MTKSRGKETVAKAREGRSTMQREKLAGYLYDLSKLTFTAMVLGAFLPILGGGWDVYNVIQFVFGSIFTISIAYAANKLLKED